jgi:hypothetical protein
MANTIRIDPAEQPSEQPPARTVIIQVWTRGVDGSADVMEREINMANPWDISESGGRLVLAANQYFVITDSG